MNEVVCPHFLILHLYPVPSRRSGNICYQLNFAKWSICVQYYTDKNVYHQTFWSAIDSSVWSRHNTLSLCKQKIQNELYIWATRKIATNLKLLWNYDQIITLCRNAHEIEKLSFRVLAGRKWLGATFNPAISTIFLRLSQPCIFSLLDILWPLNGCRKKPGWEQFISCYHQ